MSWCATSSSTSSALQRGRAPPSCRRTALATFSTLRSSISIAWRDASPTSNRMTRGAGLRLPHRARDTRRVLADFLGGGAHAVHTAWSLNQPRRFFSGGEAPSSGPLYEQEVVGMIKRKFGTDAGVEIYDRSGGCGTSYEIIVESPMFAEKTRLQRERMVQEPIRAEIKRWHAVTIKTKIPE